NLAASTPAPHRPHSTGQKAARRSSSASISLLGPGQVGRYFRLPARHRASGVDLELEPGGHVRLDVGYVPVELLVPAAYLVDRAVLGAQQRVVDPGLVQPDLHVLLEAEPDEVGELGRYPPRLRIAQAARASAD